MKKVLCLVLAVAVTFCFAAGSFAAGWDSCKGCHTDSGKPGPSKADLVKKLKTADAFVKAAKASESPMMKNFKDDAKLKAAAKDLGLK